MGAMLTERVDALRAKHSFIKEVRGKGLIVAIEFTNLTSLSARMAWKLLHKNDKVLSRKWSYRTCFQASHSHASSRSCDGCDKDSAAANYRRTGG